MKTLKFSFAAINHRALCHEMLCPSVEAKNRTIVLHLGPAGHRSCVGARLTSVFIDCTGLSTMYS